MDVVDIRRMSLSKKKGKGGMGDIRLFYEGLIRELSEKGF